MRIWLFSDFHLEFGKIPEKEITAHGIPEADLCIVPGDMHKGRYAMEALAQHVAPHMPVVYVPGNHDYYNRSMRAERAEMVEPWLREAGVHLLDPGVAVFGHVRVIGATLWTDYALLGEDMRDRAMREAVDTLNDHNQIEVGERQEDGTRVWMPWHALARHREELAFIAERLSEPFDGETVVVTHHAPHPGSIHPRYAHEDFALMNASFASDLEPFILEHRPDMWVHGHIHDSVRYRVGDTEIIANPRGYQVNHRLSLSTKYVRDREGRLVDMATGLVVPDPYVGPENRAFDPLMVIELGPSPEPRDKTAPMV